MIGTANLCDQNVSAGDASDVNGPGVLEGGLTLQQALLEAVLGHSWITHQSERGWQSVFSLPIPERLGFIPERLGFTTPKRQMLHFEQPRRFSSACISSSTCLHEADARSRRIRVQDRPHDKRRQDLHQVQTLLLGKFRSRLLSSHLCMW